MKIVAARSLPVNCENYAIFDILLKRGEGRVSTAAKLFIKEKYGNVFIEGGGGSLSKIIL